MIAKFYIRFQKKLIQIHEAEISDGASNWSLRGFLKIMPTNGKTQTIMQDLTFKRIQAESLDFAFFLFDADEEIKKHG